MSQSGVSAQGVLTTKTTLAGESGRSSAGQVNFGMRITLGSEGIERKFPLCGNNAVLTRHSASYSFEVNIEVYNGILCIWHDFRMVKSPFSTRRLSRCLTPVKFVTTANSCSEGPV